MSGGITEIPVVIRNLDDEQAIIAMVDSNIQRENIKPSEKAYAYMMRLDAINRQGTRTDLTSAQMTFLNQQRMLMDLRKSWIRL